MFRVEHPTITNSQELEKPGVFVVPAVTAKEAFPIKVEKSLCPGL